MNRARARCSALALDRQHWITGARPGILCEGARRGFGGFESDRGALRGAVAHTHSSDPVQQWRVVTMERQTRRSATDGYPQLTSSSPLHRPRRRTRQYAQRHRGGRHRRSCRAVPPNTVSRLIIDEFTSAPAVRHRLRAAPHYRTILSDFWTKKVVIRARVIRFSLPL